MKYLVDTHLLLWAASDPGRLSTTARSVIEDTDNALYFSVAALWEVVIKGSLNRADFVVDPALLRRGLVNNGYIELPIDGNHVLAVTGLPDIHRDPFDRIQIAQARVDGFQFLTADSAVAAYGDPVRKV